MQKILLVCMGNICRSPLALGVLRTLSEREQLARLVTFDAAGTHSSHRGEAPDPRAVVVAAARGYDISGFRARTVRASDFAHFDRILAMDRTNLAALGGTCPQQLQSKLSLFLPYAGISSPDEVPDPYYGGVAGFERVLDLCEEAGRRILSSA